MKKIKILLLLTLFLSAFLVRLYNFNNPIADWHSWRQSDTSAVSRNFVNNGFDILHPRFDDLSNVGSGLDNPQGYRFVEFPIYNLAQAGLFNVLTAIKSGFTIEQSGRLVSIFASLFSTLFIYLLVKKYKGENAGLLSAFFFAFLPFNIYFGRTILPDTSMVAASLGGIYFFDKWLDEKSKIKNQIFFVFSLVFTSAALLLKPYALFFTLPMIYLAWKRFGLKLFLKWQIWLFVILSVTPLVLWRQWMTQYPAGIPVSDWLFNGGGMRFKGAFFRWIFYERLTKLILGYFGIPLLIIGFFSLGGRKIVRYLKNDNIFFLSFIFSSLLYVSVLARGNIQHDYYQILTIPSIAIFLGLGADFLIRNPKKSFNKIAAFVFVFLSSILIFLFSGYQVRDFFNINNHSIVVAGEAVDRLTPKDAKVIALYNGDTSFLYQTRRKGWASFEKDLPVMIKMGAEYMVLVNPTKNDLNFGKTYKIVSLTNEYMLLDLTKKP